jgi:hypothetical protein
MSLWKKSPIVETNPFLSQLKQNRFPWKKVKRKFGLLRNKNGQKENNCPIWSHWTACKKWQKHSDSGHQGFLQ